MMKIDSKNTRFGIDKIQISTQDFELRSLEHWVNDIKKVGKETETDLPTTIRTLDGEDVKGKLYSNQPDVVFNINSYGLNATFNPSKMYHEYHLLNTGDKLNDAVKHIQETAEYIGLKINIPESRISRLDCAIQGSMNHRPNQYADAFKLCNGKRMINKAEYEGGYRMGNKSVGTICYDKAKEMRVKGVEVVPTENNLLRIENQFKKPLALARHMRFNSIPILLKMNPQELKERNGIFLGQKVFKDKRIGSQQIIDFNTEIETFQHIQEETKRGVEMVYRHLLIMGGSLADTLLKFGGIDGYFNFLIDAGVSRATAYRFRQHIEKTLRLEAKTQTNKKTVTAADLLEELITKFAA